ncbi:BadF/BadG/BcrA/BcrD ATPase family protein [Microbacterium sp. BK668]|uniref:N-acetylglucosamine kinase n=1 Tax=Microbacterium sp. BK668 TaxID=2512118 RepID=UPI00105E593E|nr:BadF/BadG/BcrA/BcrD ATPase family protein [Microbacterium sp. BK668]TDN91547.1 N-acetylglucosamine kinase-like BadF-type ATPase [Microbacterium sp. BK668]
MTLSTLAVDGGQSGTRVRHSGSPQPTEWSSEPIRTDLGLLPQLARTVAEAAARVGRIDRVGIGVSGLTAGADPVALLDEIDEFGVREVFLAHDSITSYSGALGESQGAVVAAGTGVVTLGVGPARLARVDGWGHLIGDAGSGYWVGRAALDAVLRQLDGRGPVTSLSQVVRSDFPDLTRAYIDIQSDAERVRRVAAYARAVFEAAPSDRVASDIVRRAAEELATSAATALERAAVDPREWRVAAVGGIFRADALRDAFTEAVRSRMPAARIVVDAFDPLAGAASLADIPVASPLGREILRARR